MDVSGALQSLDKEGWSRSRRRYVDDGGSDARSVDGVKDRKALSAARITC